MLKMIQHQSPLDDIPRVNCSVCIVLILIFVRAITTQCAYFHNNIKCNIYLSIDKYTPTLNFNYVSTIPLCFIYSYPSFVIHLCYPNR